MVHVSSCIHIVSKKKHDNKPKHGPNDNPTVQAGLSPFSTVAIDRPGVADGLDRMEIGLAGAEGTAREHSVCFLAHSYKVVPHS